MKLVEFMVALNGELKSMMFPKCNALERFAVGAMLGAVDFKAGQLLSEHSDLAMKFGVVDADGNINLDCVEHMLTSGVEWPQKVGPFTFSADDAKSVIQKIREKAK